ncbi:MAG: alpha/beta hydrolase domain-containing protein, partial [Planctomycetota bacterium]
GIISVIPPKMGGVYTTLVPAFDEDGNGVGGIRLPELTVPLGTYQGWNPRRREVGASEFLGRFSGSFWPFALTEEERERQGDCRPSVEERYESQEKYAALIHGACADLVSEGYMLEEDAARYVEIAERMIWPPEPIDNYPHWRTR